MKILFKILGSLSVLYLFDLINKTIETLVKNQIFLTQFEDNYESFTNYQLYQEMSKYSWIIIVIIIPLIFKREIINLIYKIKGEKQNEKSN